MTLTLPDDKVVASMVIKWDSGILESTPKGNQMRGQTVRVSVPDNSETVQVHVGLTVCRLNRVQLERLIQALNESFRHLA